MLTPNRSAYGPSPQTRSYTACQRCTGGQHSPVLAYLSDDYLQGASLTLSEGPLTGSVQARSVLGQPDLAPPALHAGGGVDSDVPLPALALHLLARHRVRPGAALTGRFRS